MENSTIIQPMFSEAGRRSPSFADEMGDFGLLLKKRMGLEESSGSFPGKRFEANIGEYCFDGLLILNRPTSSACLDVISLHGGGAFSFIKASGLGLVPATLAFEASARFRERFSSRNGAADLKSFAKDLGDNLSDLAQGRFLMGSLGSITASGEILLLPFGNPLVAIKRRDAIKSQRLQFSESPALGSIPSFLPLMSKPNKVYKLSLKPGDAVFFMHGEFDEASILPAIDGCVRQEKDASPGTDMLRSVIESLSEEEVDGQPSTWPEQPRNDSFVVMLRRRS